jgi:DNA-binding XRE family transcriptional regulator
MRALPLTKSARPGGRPRSTRAPRNAFADWLAESKAKPDVLAKDLGISVSAIYNLRNSYYLPGRELAVKIADVSKDAVSVESWSAVKPRPRGKGKG